MWLLFECFVVCVWYYNVLLITKCRDVCALQAWLHVELVVHHTSCD